MPRFFFGTADSLKILCNYNFIQKISTFLNFLRQFYKNCPFPSILWFLSYRHCLRWWKIMRAIWPLPQITNNFNCNPRFSTSTKKNLFQQNASIFRKISVISSHSSKKLYCIEYTDPINLHQLCQKQRNTPSMKP